MSRFAKLYLLTFAGSCIFIPLMLHGHGRAAALLCLAWMAMEFVIFSKMKPAPNEFARFRKAGQIKTARRFRMCAYVLMAIAIFALIKTYKLSPWWPNLIGLAINGSFQWAFFRAAKRVEEMAPDEWERRSAK
jgi:hypothetical protein